MGVFDSYLVTAVIFAPLVGAGVLAFFPAKEKGQLKVVTLVAMLATFALALWMYLAFQVHPLHGGEFQLEARKAWVPGLGISYHVGVDGLAVTLMLLTAFLGPIVTLSAWNGAGERVKEFCLALLVLQSAMLGAFAALDLVLFYVFWEAMLIPMYLLIGVFGSENRVYAAVKFFLFTMAGSMLMLVAILYLYWLTGVHGGPRSFDLAAILNQGVPHGAQMWLFLAFALAFAVKVPMFPLHTWLPDAHTEAPAAGSIILAGVLLKMGTFGFMRYAMPLFPQAAAEAAPWLGVLAVIGIVYGSLMCMAQRDMKRLVAYSSVAHLGFVMLGLSAVSVQAGAGAVYQMVNHGVSTGALFLLIGLMYERRHTRLIADYGGLARVTPVLAASFVVVTLSSIGLPGTNGFVGEFLILSGTFSSPFFTGLRGAANGFLSGHGGAVLAAIGATGVILGAVYMLTLVQRLWFGPVRNPRNRGLADLNLREVFAVAPLVLAAVGMGIYPQPFLERITPAAERFAQRVSGIAVPMEVLPLAQEGAAAPGPPVVPMAEPAAGPRGTVVRAPRPVYRPAEPSRPLALPAPLLRNLRPVPNQ